MTQFYFKLFRAAYMHVSYVTLNNFSDSDTIILKLMASDDTYFHFSSVYIFSLSPEVYILFFVVALNRIISLLSYALII